MLSDYRFRPAWKVSLAALVTLVALVGLGVWQLERAKESMAIRDHYRARSRMAPIDINTSALHPATAEFRRADVKGRYRGDFTIYVDNKVLNGIAGYYVLTPLEILNAPGAGVAVGTGRFILVNRGWRSWGGSRQSLPAVDTPGGVVALSGRLKAPPKYYFTLQRHPPTKFTRLWENLDLARYRKITGLAVSALVLRLDPNDTGGGGFVRQWPEYTDPWVQRHNGYAIQWFSMAFILVVMYVGLNIEKRSTGGG